MFVKIRGKTHYLWRAVVQQGTMLDILVTSRRDTRAATRSFRKLLKGLQYVPRVLVTGKRAATPAARRRVLRSAEHRQSKYLNNRTEMISRYVYSGQRLLAFINGASVRCHSRSTSRRCSPPEAIDRILPGSK